MADSMTDEKFIKIFGIFIVLGVILTLALIFLGNINAGSVTQEVRKERNAMVTNNSDENGLEPVGSLNIAKVEDEKLAEDVEVVENLVQAEAGSPANLVKGVTTGSDGQMMVFEPGYIKVEVGETITFEPSDASHNAESIFTPTQDSSFATKMGEKVSITFTQEGVYLYKCTPHFTMAMVGVIQVGNATNKDDAIAAWQSMSDQMAMNKGRMEKYLEEIN